MKASLGQTTCRESIIRALAGREPVDYAMNRVFLGKALIGRENIALLLPGSFRCFCPCPVFWAWNLVSE